jgi:hypothetical protein
MPAATRTVTRYTGVATSRYSGDSILPKLKKLDTSFRTRWLALLIAGALVSMIGPVIFGTATFIRQYRAGGVGIGVEQEPWLHHVGYACLWILPILFVIERVTRGKLVEDTVEGVSDMPRFIGGRAVAGAVFVEVMLWGPRMVTAGVRRQVGLNRQRRADRALAAAMLAELLNRGDGLPIGEVFKIAQDRGDSAFSAALAYLMFHDLVDLSKPGDRVWVCSDGKRAIGVA